MHGHWRYLYRAIDRNGTLVGVMFSERRDMAAAKALFQSAKTVIDITPDYAQPLLEGMKRFIEVAHPSV